MKKALAILVACGVAGLGIYLALAYRSALPPLAADQKPDFSQGDIDKGRVLAAAGYCAVCHTAKDGAPYAGNYAMATGFGTIYSSNITPDKETGIGTWTEEAFHRAMTRGVNQKGQHLFPAFPYDHFTKMRDDDIKALYAYIMSEVKPVKQTKLENSLPFPLDMRIWQAGWKFLFVDFGTYKPDPDKSDEWNRGAYLVEGLTHCGACHTPRNFLGAEEHDKMFAGAHIENWVAPALTAENASAVPWTASAFYEFLKTGVTTYHGVSAGPMGPVVHGGVQKLPDNDLRAMSVYLADKTDAPQEDPAKLDAVQKALAADKPDPAYRYHEGERLYATACAACHYNSQTVNPDRPALTLNSVTRMASPDNLIQVILNGVNSKTGIAGVVMPAYRTALNDEEIALIAEYLRTKRADLPEWTGLKDQVAKIRKETGASD